MKKSAIKILIILFALLTLLVKTNVLAVTINTNPYPITAINVVKVQTCPVNSYYDSANSACKCNVGYILSGNNCILNLILLDASQINTTQPATTPSIAQPQTGNSQATTCPANSYYDSAAGCVCNSAYVSSGGKCILGSGYCSNFYGPNSVYDTNKGTCKCAAGFRWNVQNSYCVDNNTYCDERYGGTIYNASTNSCICPDGYSFEGARCTPSTTNNNQATTKICPTNSTSSAIGCVCNSGYKPNSANDGCILTSNCNTGYTLKDGACVSSTQNISSTTTKQTMQTIQLTDQDCAIVSDHSLSDGFSCVCETGYKWNSDNTTCIKKVLIFTKNLKLGNRNNEVLELQKLLKTEGYSIGKPTNYFGTITRAQLVKFQKDRGIKPTGVTDLQTRAVLNSL